MLSTQPNALSIYIHWPFCLSKCPYCDFNSHVREEIDQELWSRALCREIDYWGEKPIKGPIKSIFFGGGTPSLMEPKIVQNIVEKISSHWPIVDDIEITLEANPTSAEANKFKGFKSAGINRLSLGIQSLDDNSLKFLGRQHDAASAILALEMAFNIFPRLSFDMIYALPKQTASDWKIELRKAINVGAGHLSLYQLTIEKGTPFYSLYKSGGLGPLDDETAIDLYETTYTETQEAGYSAYEVSNYARVGHACVHNLGYWRYNDYIGIGPGAHSRVRTYNKEIYAVRQHSKPEKWLDSVKFKGHGTAENRELQGRESAEEMLMMSLRLKEGLDLQQFHKVIGLRLDDIVNRINMTNLINAGFLKRNSKRLYTTKKGTRVLNTVLGQLLAV